MRNKNVPMNTFVFTTETGLYLSTLQYSVLQYSTLQYRVSVSNFVKIAEFQLNSNAFYVNCYYELVSDNRYTILADLLFSTNSIQLMFRSKCVVIPLCTNAALNRNFIRVSKIT